MGVWKMKRHVLLSLVISSVGLFLLTIILLVYLTPSFWPRLPLALGPWIIKHHPSKYRVIWEYENEPCNTALLERVSSEKGQFQQLLIECLTSNSESPQRVTGASSLLLDLFKDNGVVIDASTLMRVVGKMGEDKNFCLSIFFLMDNDFVDFNESSLGDIIRVIEIIKKNHSGSEEIMYLAEKLNEKIKQHKIRDSEKK
jgi:hypothetical protein